MNSIVMQGQVSRIYRGSRNNVMTPYIRGRRMNLPQIVFTGKARNLLDDIADGDYVKVSGCMKTIGERQEDGHILHTQFVKGEDIVIVDAPEEGGRFDFVNDIEIEGKIVRASASNNMVTLLVNPAGDKFNIWIFQYAENAEDLLDTYKAGSNIKAICEMQTVRKEINNEVKFFENIVIREASVEEAAE